MTKIKSFFLTLYLIASAPEFRPFEVKLARALALAVLAMIGVNIGQNV